MAKSSLISRAASMEGQVTEPVTKDEFHKKFEDSLRSGNDIGTGLGKRLAFVREARKFTQGELAKRLGRSRATVNQYESGMIEPPLKMLIKLAEALGVDPGLLAFGGSPQRSATGGRLQITGSDTEDGEFVELSSGLSSRLRIDPESGQLVELEGDAPSFGLRRGDLIFLDTSVTSLHGDGSLYMVRGRAGSLAIVRSDIQIVEQAENVKLTFGQGQVSEVDPRRVEVVGRVKASLRLE